MTFYNPYGDYVFEFGSSVAAFGNDRVLISAESYGSGFGQVFLFNTNGTLLKTITNPTPAVSDYFGHKLAALGNDRVLISASGDDTGATDSGSAYVYSIDGTLLATINNPAPADFDRFGHRLAAFGSEGAIIGTMYEDTGASIAESAYLFSIPSTPTSPSLTIQHTTTNTVSSHGQRRRRALCFSKTPRLKFTELEQCHHPALRQWDNEDSDYQFCWQPLLSANKVKRKMCRHTEQVTNRLDALCFVPPTIS